MTANTKLKYLFIGNLINKNNLGEYPNKSSEEYAAEGKQIFQHLCKTDYNKFEERQKIDSRNGHFFFTTSLNGIFYLAFADTGYPDRYVFELFDKVQQEGINIMINDKAELNSNGNEKLKGLFKKYQDPQKVNLVAQANLEIEGVKVEMKNTIQSMVSNVSDLSALDAKSQKLKEGSQMFQKDAKELERLTWWKNCKLTVIIIVIVIAVILCIVIPLVVKGSGESKSNNSNTQSNNTTKIF